MHGKILVAEDDPEARELLKRLLAGQYQLLEAADGIEALDLLHSQHPDLLITDIVMPHMDGYELVRKLRQDERTANMPVILCSASYHEHEARELARCLGVSDTLLKPFDRKVVHSAVEAALASRPPSQAAHQRRSLSNGGAAQDRLSALVSFSQQLFGQADPGGIVESTAHAARHILLAQCARLVISEGGQPRYECTASGLTGEQLGKLLEGRMYRDLLKSLEAGGFALHPVPLRPSAQGNRVVAPGEFVSILGVPIASATNSYGYLCVVNRIGLPGFTQEDLAVAGAIAVQVAVAYENARRQRTLREEFERRAQMEMEVRRLNRDLERRVAERTSELEIANRELDAFSYSVAHDLRAPLRLIHAHVQMLREYRGPPEARQRLMHLEQIQRGATDMGALIDGLLTLSRVSQVEMRREPISLAVLAKRACDQAARDTPDRTIDWRIGELPSVSCDAELMQQVFANLIANAVKYTRPCARAVIEVGVGRVDGENYIFVRDNGVGFDMRYAHKLFGVFQRLHRQDEFEGTGIGLATVNRIIERHGGRIWVRSRVNAGTEFRFTLAGL